jgi:thioredoxin reductase
MKRVAIIGAGPAGIACALQLKRHGIAPVIFERDAVGGLLRNANLVENYPGFPHGISGPQLIKLFTEQLTNAGTEVVHESVREITYATDVWSIQTDRRIICAEIVVLACGTKPRSIPGLAIPAIVADRVFYEVYPLFDLQDKTVAVIGAGDAAFDYALSLAARNDVIILNRGEKVSALPLLSERSKQNTRITYLAETRIGEIALCCGRLSLSCNDKQGQRIVKADYLLLAVGRDPGLDVLAGELTETNRQLITAGKLYLIGDVKNDLFRQTAICVGDGVKAAMDIAYRG